MPTLRPATRADASRVALIHRLGWSGFRGLVPDPLLDDPTLEHGMLQRWTAQLTGERATIVRVVEDLGPDGNPIVVGFSSTGPCADPGEDDSAELWDLWVHPDHRGRGLGAQLLAEALDRLPRPVVVWVLAANVDAARFYRREGAIPDGLARTQTHRPVTAAGPVAVSTTEHRLRWP